MKSIQSIFLISLTISLLSFSQKDDGVYVCASGESKKYHLSKDCRGLNACTHEIKEMDIIEAKKSGKELCSWED